MSMGRDDGNTLAWLPVVRWAACAALWSVVAAAWLLPALNLSLRAIAPLALAAAIGRTLVVFLLRRGTAVPRWLSGVSYCADAALLTGLLDITGGPFNPFVVMFATYVWLSAVTLSRRWALLVLAVSTAGFTWLVLDHVQAEVAAHHRLNDFPAHLFTMWLSGTAIAELVAHYVFRARATLNQRQRQLEAARERALRSEHLASLTTLAAGAAHELSTPLATIAVAARELEHATTRLSLELTAVEPLREDARLIRTEVDRCQVILDGMSGRAPGGAGSNADPLHPEAIIDLVRARLSDGQRRRLRVTIAADAPVPVVPGVGMVQAISALLRNAFEASSPGTEVSLQFERHASMVRIAVRDRGAGMSADVLRRVGEPFYTTKPPGRGMGLGLFLARTFAERSGGTLQFEMGDGTIAVLEIPAAVPAETIAV